MIPRMRQVLVVSPNFPPNDAVDMHRIRMTVGHFTACGWRPVVLRVAPGDTGRSLEPDLLRTLPDDLEVIEVAAPQGRLAAAIGLNAAGLRAWSALNRAGKALLASRPFDLVFITTTAFPVMALGRVWKQRFGVPFVLDFQDPWATFPASAAPFMRPGLKHRLMRLIHARLEAWTLPSAGGLMAVSERYIDLLRGAYPALRERPAVVSPFPYSVADFAASARYGRAIDGLTPSANGMSCLYAGRIAPAMEPSLRACFALVAAGRRRRPGLFDRLHFVFVGTGYSASGNPSVAGRLAAEAGMADRVLECPDRISFLDAQKSMLDAGMLLVLGSDDDAYTPSKLNQSLSLPKPILCAAPATSCAAEAVRGLSTVLSIDSRVPPTDAEIDRLGDQLEDLLRAGASGVYSERDGRTRPFEAAAAAARDCDLFDRVLDASGVPGKGPGQYGG